jgi:hypothetical protein
VRRAAQKATKRVRMDSSDEDSDLRSSGSEFKLSASDSDDSDEASEDSNASDDFNPFDEDSDSDAGKNINILLTGYHLMMSLL